VSGIRFRRARGRDRIEVMVRVRVRVWVGVRVIVGFRRSILHNLNSNVVFYFRGELGYGELGRRQVGLRRVGTAASWAAASRAAASCRGPPPGKNVPLPCPPSGESWRRHCTGERNPPLTMVELESRIFTMAPKRIVPLG
jgi:hypothetical protein